MFATLTFINPEVLNVIELAIPFFIVFIFAFALFAQINFLNRMHSAILAIIMGLATIVPHILGRYEKCANIVVIINNALPKVSVFIVFALLVIFAVGAFGFKNRFGKGFLGTFAIVALLFILYAFASSRGEGCGSDLSFSLTSIPWEYIIPLLLIGLVLWLSFRNAKPSQWPERRPREPRRPGRDPDMY